MSNLKKFYPSIEESLLWKALDFAEVYNFISTDNKSTIHTARKSSLFSNEGTWVKRESGLFNVSMGEYDGARLSILVSNFLLHELSEKCEIKKRHWLSDIILRPFFKSDNKILYIHRESNHSSSIIRQLPLSLERRFIELSSDEKKIRWIGTHLSRSTKKTRM